MRGALFGDRCGPLLFHLFYLWSLDRCCFSNWRGWGDLSLRFDRGSGRFHGGSLGCGGRLGGGHNGLLLFLGGAHACGSQRTGAGVKFFVGKCFGRG